MGQVGDLEAANMELEDTNTQLDGFLQAASSAKEAALAERDTALAEREAAMAELEKVKEEAQEQQSLRADADAYIAEMRASQAALKACRLLPPTHFSIRSLANFVFICNFILCRVWFSHLIQLFPKCFFQSCSLFQPIVYAWFSVFCFSILSLAVDRPVP